MAADSGTLSRTRTRLTMHLGVIVQPYRTPEKKVLAITTGDVATILESRYGIMETFWRVKQKPIVEALTASLAGSLESLLMGQRVAPFGRATGQIEKMFRDFISTREAERVGIPGTPTLAALQGVDHRKKHPYALRPRRPSFRDTGLYMTSFKVWF